MPSFHIFPMGITFLPTKVVFGPTWEPILIEGSRFAGFLSTYLWMLSKLKAFLGRGHPRGGSNWGTLGFLTKPSGNLKELLYPHRETNSKFAPSQLGPRLPKDQHLSGSV